MRRRALVLGIFLLVLLAGGASRADAQGFIAPFIGFNYGGDSQCPTFNAPCEEKSNNLGVAFGRLGTLGFETDFGYVKNFFGDTAGIASNLLTISTNLLIAPRIGPVRPYVLGGVGVIRTRVESIQSGVLSLSNTNIGYDLGVGLMVFAGSHVGVRGDLRRFKSFDESGLFSILPGSNEKIQFNRASAALVLAF